MATTKINTNQVNSIHSINAPRGYLLNGKIVPSVASNNLTVAIKGLDGNDPSVNNPVYCRIGDTVRAITAALSVTKNAGTNWFNSGSSELATKEVDYFVFLGYNATDGVVVGFARVPYPYEYVNFSTTSTNAGYGAISTITNAASEDDYELIGRFAATLSAGAGYTWTVPTFTNQNLIQRPIYETRTLSWTPTYTGFSANPTLVYAYYVIREKNIYIRYRDNAGGTSNATTFKISIPFPCGVSSASALFNIATDNGTRLPPGFVDITSTTMDLYKPDALGAWTNSGTKGCEGLNIFYEAY